ncbi:hypothetical protein MOQ_001602 [Trypanosoma cruzi marinkellei]|uniref:Uncharacterized protein n=1 Tax=Trypanosoma cruzi marinkellei TaxID=85056 RepID=K2NT51_TRYCR|nr:hypothetical protein MOQ_001602 [Trypanosoma cruzi marinkellei]
MGAFFLFLFFVVGGGGEGRGGIETPTLKWLMYPLFPPPLSLSPPLCTCFSPFFLFFSFFFFFLVCTHVYAASTGLTQKHTQRNTHFPFSLLFPFLSLSQEKKEVKRFCVGIFFFIKHADGEMFFLPLWVAILCLAGVTLTCFVLNLWREEKRKKAILEAGLPDIVAEPHPQQQQQEEEEKRHGLPSKVTSHHVRRNGEEEMEVEVLSRSREVHVDDGSRTCKDIKAAACFMKPVEAAGTVTGVVVQSSGDVARESSCTSFRTHPSYLPRDGRSTLHMEASFQSFSRPVTPKSEFTAASASASAAATHSTPSIDLGISMTHSSSLSCGKNIRHGSFTLHDDFMHTNTSEAHKDDWGQSDVNEAVEKKSAAASVYTSNNLFMPCKGSDDAVCHADDALSGRGGGGGSGGHKREEGTVLDPFWPSFQRHFTADAGNTFYSTCGDDGEMFICDFEKNPTTEFSDATDGTPRMPPIGASAATAAPSTSGVLFLPTAVPLGGMPSSEPVPHASVLLLSPLAATPLTVGNQSGPTFKENSKVVTSMDT